MSGPSRDAPPIASVEDLPAWTEGGDEKWQLMDGVLVMMAGGSAASRSKGPTSRPRWS